MSSRAHGAFLQTLTLAVGAILLAMEFRISESRWLV